MNIQEKNVIMCLIIINNSYILNVLFLHFEYNIDYRYTRLFTTRQLPVSVVAEYINKREHLSNTGQLKLIIHRHANLNRTIIVVSFY